MSSMHPDAFTADELVGIAVTSHERKALSLAVVMQLIEIPNNDCVVFANVFRMLSDLNKDYGLVTTEAAKRALHYDARRLLLDLEIMHAQNHAVRKFRRELNFR